MMLKKTYPPFFLILVTLFSGLQAAPLNKIRTPIQKIDVLVNKGKESAKKLLQSAETKVDYLKDVITNHEEKADAAVQKVEHKVQAIQKKAHLALTADKMYRKGQQKKFALYCKVNGGTMSHTKHTNQYACQFDSASNKASRSSSAKTPESACTKAGYHWNSTKNACTNRVSFVPKAISKKIKQTITNG